MKVMRAKFFFIISFCLTLISVSLVFNVETRELSIQQLEERKKLDSERKKRIDKKGKKSFQKDITISTEVVFLSKERRYI